MKTPADAPQKTTRYQDARRRLYEAAIRLFRTKGFDATTADDIAAEAGLSRATFFNHFGNKSAVLRFFGQDLEEQVCSLLAGRADGTAPLDELRRILLAMASAAEAERENLKIVLIHSLENGTYFSEPTPARARILQQITDLIAEAQANGEARTDLTARALAVQLVALYNNAIAAILFSNQTHKTAISRAWEFALGGLNGPATAAKKQTS